MKPILTQPVLAANGTFTDSLHRMPEYEAALKTILPADLHKLRNVPGVYVLYEAGAPFYVGKTDNLAARLHQHSYSKSTHNSASFAFRLARLDWAAVNTSAARHTRTSLQGDAAFKEIFTRAKQRVGRMDMHYVEVRNSNDQYLFEFWLSLKLRTPHNQFVNT